ncbi:MAG: hypothetical protein JNK79_12380 [Chitinophagaceae bacterium]|nr:hypothetical protein [Chitinophagaceae bacterium]
MKYAGIFFLVICDIAITSFSFNNVAFEKEFGRLRDICISPAGDVYISTSNRDWNPAPGFPTSSDDRIIKLTLSKVSS